MSEPKSVGDKFFANGSSLLVRNENHENQLDARLAECAGALGGDLRGSEMRLKTSALDSTRQRLPCGKGGGFNRYAHSAGPILTTLFYPIFDPHAHRQIIDMVILSRMHQPASNFMSFVKN